MMRLFLIHHGLEKDQTLGLFSTPSSSSPCHTYKKTPLPHPSTFFPPSLYSSASLPLSSFPLFIHLSSSLLLPFIYQPPFLFPPSLYSSASLPLFSFPLFIHLSSSFLLPFIYQPPFLFPPSLYSSASLPFSSFPLFIHIPSSFLLPFIHPPPFLFPPSLYSFASLPLSTFQHLPSPPTTPSFLNPICIHILPPSLPIHLYFIKP